MEKSKKNKTETAHVKSTAAATPPRVISEAEIEACLAHLQAIGDVLAPYATTLSPAARRSATRLRKGGEKVIPLMGRLAESVGVAGDVFDVDAMQKQVDLANALIPLLTRAKTLADVVSDTVLAAKGSAWSSATRLHGVLKQVAKQKPEMRRDMEVVSGAFKRKSAASKTPDEPAKDAAPPGEAGKQQAPTA